MAIIRQSLTETANTFSQNQTLNGTANTAPNQTAASASSLMSRTLVDDEPFFNIGRCFSPLPVPSTGTAGGGTVSVNTNGNYVNLLMVNSAAVSSYARASLARNISPVQGFSAGTSLDFLQRVGFMFKGIAAGANMSNLTNPAISRIIVGGNGGVPAASNANALTNLGFGIELWGYDSSGDSDFVQYVRAFAHNGTTYSVGSWVSINPFVAGSFGAISNGAGSVSLYYGLGLARPTIIQTISGGPTTPLGTTSNWVDAVAVNGSAATTGNSAVLTITDMKIIAG